MQEYSVDIGADYDGELLISDKHGLFVCGGCLDSEHFDCDKEENRARDIQGPKQYFPENKHACPISTEPFPFNNVIRIANE